MRICILYVEDEEIDRLAALRIIMEEGPPFDMATAGTLQEASDLLKKNEYDIVLLDYSLPDGIGLDILEWLNGTASIFVTGSGREHESGL